MNNPKYLFKLAFDVHFIQRWIPDSARIESEWLESRGSECVVKAGYAWDGASPKSLFWSTWDGWVQPVTVMASGRLYSGPVTMGGEPHLYMASLVHDVNYQFIRKISRASALSVWRVRSLADETFGEIMRMAKWPFARKYERMVRLFGWAPVLARVLRETV